MDRAIRAVVGPTLMALGYTVLEGREGCLGGLAAIVVGATIVESAITGVCPVNAALKLDTRSALERERADQELIARLRERDAVAAFTSSPPIVEERPPLG